MTDRPSVVDTLKDLVASLPEEAEDEAFAALSVLSDPGVAAAALDEQLRREQRERVEPHLVKGAVRIETTKDVYEGGVLVERGGRSVADEADCPDCTRGTYSIGGVLVCIRLIGAIPTVGTLGGSEGDIVACGGSRG